MDESPKSSSVQSGKKTAPLLEDRTLISEGVHTEQELTRQLRIPLSVRFLTLLALFAVIIAAMTIRTGVSVSFNGRKVGILSNKQDLENVLQSVENQVSQSLGVDYNINQDLSTHMVLTLKNRVLNSESLENQLIANISNVSYSHMISFEGQDLGAASTQREIEEAEKLVLASYSGENVLSVVFAEEFQISYGLFDSQLVLAGDSLFDALSAIPVAVTTSTTEALPYSTEYIDDDSIYQEQSRIVSEGVPGEGIFKTLTTYKNGEIIGTEQSLEEVITEPVSEVMAKGTKKQIPTASTGNFAWPLRGSLNSRFGKRSVSVGSSNHKGIDIGAGYGASITAADGGNVIFADWDSGYGYLVKIRHDNGYITYYAHCSKLDVSAGQRVYKGQHIAKVGSTGTASGNHLHFEVHVNGSAVDPLKYLP